MSSRMTFSCHSIMRNSSFTMLMITSLIGLEFYTFLFTMGFYKFFHCHIATTYSNNQIIIPHFCMNLHSSKCINTFRNSFNFYLLVKISFINFFCKFTVDLTIFGCLIKNVINIICDLSNFLRIMDIISGILLFQFN